MTQEVMTTPPSIKILAKLNIEIGNKTNTETFTYILSTKIRGYWDAKKI